MTAEMRRERVRLRGRGQGWPCGEDARVRAAWAGGSAPRRFGAAARRGASPSWRSQDGCAPSPEFAMHTARVLSAQRPLQVGLCAAPRWHPYGAAPTARERAVKTCGRREPTQKILHVFAPESALWGVEGGTRAAEQARWRHHACPGSAATPGVWQAFSRAIARAVSVRVRRAARALGLARRPAGQQARPRRQLQLREAVGPSRSPLAAPRSRL
jgi:hypothetical protein